MPVLKVRIPSWAMNILFQDYYEQDYVPEMRGEAASLVEDVVKEVANSVRHAKKHREEEAEDDEECEECEEVMVDEDEDEYLPPERNGKLPRKDKPNHSEVEKVKAILAMADLEVHYNPNSRSEQVLKDKCAIGSKLTRNYKQKPGTKGIIYPFVRDGKTVKLPVSSKYKRVLAEIYAQQTEEG